MNTSQKRLDRIAWTAGAVAAVAMLSAGGVVHAAQQVFIRQQHLRFSQSSVDIAAGDTLTFTNEDDVIHNIGVRDGGDTQDLGLQKPKASVSHRFGQPGDFTIVCSIHPRMRLKVKVR